LLLDCFLADKTNPWIQGHPDGDMAHLPHTLAKYVQDAMWHIVQWIPAPSVDRADKLDAQQLRDLLRLVVAWDPRKPKDGELAICNSLRISVPGPVEQEVRVCVSSCHVQSAEDNIHWKLLYCGQVVIRAHPVKSNPFHGNCPMDWIMFLPPWCPKPVWNCHRNT
jgi:hypothetical protein